jgi:ATP-dependent helicase/nuclease subunit A
MTFDSRMALDTRRHVIVEACAGSGKTWLLSSRIVRAILEGTPPRDIVALTYTNKAAAEMRNRVVEMLRHLATSDARACRVQLESWGLENESLDLAMERAPGAFHAFLSDPQPPVIATFHSWYMRLAAMAPLAIAGLATRSLAHQPWDLMRQAWRLFFDRDVTRLPYRELVQRHGRMPTRQAMEDWVQGRVEWHALAGVGALPRLSLDQAHSVFDDARADTQRQIGSFYAAQSPRARLFAEAFRGLPGRENLQGLFERWQDSEFEPLMDTLITTRPSGERTHWADSRYRFKGGSRFIRKSDLAQWARMSPDIACELTQFLHDINALLDACDLVMGQARTRALWICAERLAECLDEIMAQSHETDFAGLECIAWDLMAGHASEAFHARLHQRVRHLLVDEFQDTNPVQWAMLKSWLAQYDQSDLSMREEAPRVFIVGDPKQSIYRFRRADPQVFRAAANWLATTFHAAKLQTETTRRCGPEVVAFLNRAMPCMAAPGRYVMHHTLAPHLPGGVRRLPLASSRGEEGDGIAHALIDIRRQCPEMTWQSMRVVLRTRTHMEHIEQAFAHLGIPYVSDRPGGLLGSPEVRDVIALLRFLAFPWSDRDCAQVLKSPVLGLSDAVLIDLLSSPEDDLPRDSADPLRGVSGHSRSRKSTLYARLCRRAAAGGGPADVKQAADDLSLWLEWSHHLPVHDLLDRILSSRALLARFAVRFAAGRGAQCLANLEAFIELALDLDTGRLPSLPRFIRELERWAQAQPQDAPASGSLSSVDAVRISSLHGVKGLEADVVVMAGMLDREKPDSGLRWLVQWTESRDAILGVDSWRSGEPLTPGAGQAFEDAERQAEDESFNLLYVGATRAKRFLLFSATARPSDTTSESADAQESDATSVEGAWYRRIEGFCDPWQPPVPSAIARGSDPAVPSLSWWAPLGGPGNAFQGTQAGDRNATGHAEAVAAETLAIRRGRALHRLLEFGKVLSPTVAQVLLAEFVLPAAAADEVLQAVARILNTPRLARIFDPRLMSFSEREWPAVAGGEAILVRPDRVVRVSASPEIWWVVDFKWQVLASERADYAAQLKDYADALQERRPDAMVSAMIVTATAELWELIDDCLVHSG